MHEIKFHLQFNPEKSPDAILKIFRLKDLNAVKIEIKLNGNNSYTVNDEEITDAEELIKKLEELRGKKINAELEVSYHGEKNKFLYDNFIKLLHEKKIFGFARVGWSCLNKHGGCTFSRESFNF